MRSGGRRAVRGYRPGVYRAAATLLVATAIAGAAVACTSVGDIAEEGRNRAEQLSDRARFCLALARTVAAVESGSLMTAEQAAEELLAQTPEELREDAQALVDEFTAVRERGGDPLEDPDLLAAAEQLRDDATARCDPLDEDDAT